jgi:hypothetical protein
MRPEIDSFYMDRDDVRNKQANNNSNGNGAAPLK